MLDYIVSTILHHNVELPTEAEWAAEEGGPKWVIT